MKANCLQKSRALFAVLAILLMSVVGIEKMYAQIFIVGDLRYIINDDNVSVRVVGHLDNIGAQVPFYIPESIRYQDRDYVVTIIGNYSFYGCEGLTQLVIPNSVTTIGNYAFYECNDLTHMDIPNSVTTIGDNAFYQCEGLTSVNIGNSVTTIGGGAFYHCEGLTHLDIPNSVTTIGGSAFSRCKGLTHLDIPNSVTTIGGGAFQGCTGLTGSLVIPNSVTTIGDWAFEYCIGLTSVEIPNSVTSLGAAAFARCDNLRVLYNAPNVINTWNKHFPPFCRSSGTVKIGSGVESIPSKLFKDSYISSVTLSPTVNMICDSAFANAPLSSITSWNANPPQLGENAFLNVGKHIQIKVPCGAEEAFMAANGWNEFDNYTTEGMFPFNLSVSTDVSGGCITNISQYPSCESNQATVEAVARTGYKFIAWLLDGEEVSSEATYTLSVDRDMDLVAHVISNIGCEESLTHAVSIGPNPTSGQVRIEADDIKHIGIFNVLGQCIYEANVDGNGFEYHFAGQEAGTYIIRIELVSGVVTERVILMR